MTSVNFKNEDIKDGQLPQLPAETTEIHVLNGTNLTSIKTLPSNLTILDLWGCSKLESLPEIPDSIREIYLDHCDSLIPTTELKERLVALEKTGVTVSYPKNFFIKGDIEAEEAKLDTAIQKYILANPNEPKPLHIKSLLHELLSDDSESRGGLAAITKDTSPILELFNHNPQQLKWANDVAGIYLEGCVNQPVLGWMEISALSMIGSASSIADKVETAKYLMAQEVTSECVSKIPKAEKTNKDHEAEYGIVLLRNVHKKLLSEKDISQPWPGIPELIQSESSTSNIMQSHIDVAYLEVKKILEKTPQQIASYLVIGKHSTTWGMLAFPEQISQIKTDCMQKIDVLDQISDIKNNTRTFDETLEDFKSEEEKQRFLEKYESLKDNDSAGVEALKQYTYSMAEEKITTTVSDLTFAALSEQKENKTDEVEVKASRSLVKRISDLIPKGFSIKGLSR